MSATSIDDSSWVMRLLEFSGLRVLQSLCEQARPAPYQWRLLRYFSVARVMIGLAFLLHYSRVLGGLGWQYWYQHTVLSLALPYGGLGLGLLWLAWGCKRQFYTQVLLGVAVDLAVLVALYFALEATHTGLAVFFLQPVLLAASLGTTLFSLFMASMVSLAVLYMPMQAVWRHQQSDLGLLEAGLYGVAFMALSWMVRELAQRQIQHAALAVAHQQALHLQQAISRLMVHDMQDGILLVRMDGQVVAMNPAAMLLTGLSSPGQRLASEQSSEAGMPVMPETLLPKLCEQAHLKPILDALQRWIGLHDDLPQLIELHRPSLQGVDAYGQTQQFQGGSALLRVRFVRPALDKPAEEVGFLHTHVAWPAGTSTHTGAPPVQHWGGEVQSVLQDTVLIYLESWEKVAEQAQQEKLAAMGRLVAGIAHEIRNPLAAISHAGELLLEATQENGGGQEGGANAMMQTRLLQIVRDNVGRINRTVSDVLVLSRLTRHASPVRLERVLPELARQWWQGAPRDTLDPRLLQFDIAVVQAARFDLDQLRQVLVNLLDNALRYCQRGAGAIRIQTWQEGPGQVQVAVWNDGPEISLPHQQRLFEPFFTTDARGTGLGLYLARELCHANQASISYTKLPLRQLRRAHARTAGAQPQKAFIITLQATEVTENSERSAHTLQAGG